jgi:hypothetical protein
MGQAIKNAPHGAVYLSARAEDHHFQVLQLDSDLLGRVAVTEAIHFHQLECQSFPIG